MRRHIQFSHSGLAFAREADNFKQDRCCRVNTPGRQYSRIVLGDQRPSSAWGIESKRVEGIRFLQQIEPRRTAMPNEIIDSIRPGFEQIFQRNIPYRSTGIVLFDLGDDSVAQLDLFGAALKTIQMKRLFAGGDAMRNKYGKHTLYLGSSHLANKFAQHLGERGDEPLRKKLL